MKKILSLFMMMILLGIIHAETVTIITENMGTGASGNPTVSNYTGFQNYGEITFTGTADVRNNTPSGTYTDASGGNNVFITNNTDRYFTISGINTANYTDLGLSFGFWKSSGASTPATSNDLVVEVATDYNSSTNTGTFTALSFANVTTGSAWSLVTITGGTIPSSATLAIRFRQNQATQQFRIDDVVLTGTSGGSNTDPKIYKLVTPATQLDAGKYLIIGAYQGNNFALGKQNNNNRSSIPVTVSDNSITTTFATTNDDELPFEITIGGSAGSWTIFDEVNDNYLRPATASGSNQLIGTANVSTWTITIEENNTAVITCFGEQANSGGRNIIRYNNSSNLFACYSTGQQPVYLYKVSSEAPTQVAMPTFNPTGGTFYEPVEVEITSATSGHTIYYTTDGSTPTISPSNLYSGPVSISTTTTLKAMAVKAGMENSEVNTATYTITEQPTMPPIVFSGVYGGGGAGASLFINDYIELYNTTDQDINISGYALYYGSATGANTSSSFIFPDGSTIGAKKFALIRAAGGGGGEAWTIDFDFECNLALAAASGKLLLLSEAYAGNVPLPSLPAIQALENYVDYLPFGVATPVFGSSMSALSASLAAKRNYNDGTKVMAYTFNVGADFTVLTVDENTPRNSSYGAINQVSTPTFSHAGGTYTSPISVTITSTEGATIRYTTNGDEPTETTGTLYTAPVNISTTTILKAKAWKDGFEPSNTASATYTFPIDVPNIGAFKAANSATNTTLYRITGDVTFVYRNGRNIFIQDETGGLSIFDSATPVITASYNNGDVISGGVTGTYTLYSGWVELLPTQNLAEGIPGEPVGPIVLTMADLLADFSQYESQLVKLEMVTFNEGTFGTGANGSIGIHQNDDEMICRNQFGTLTGHTTNPAGRFDVTGFVIPYNTDRQIAPRDLDDIEEITYNITLISAPSGAGTLTGGGTKSYNVPVTINATPTAAYDFINWTENGEEVTTNNQYSFNALADRTFTANFQIKTYTITSSVSGGNGTIDPLGITTVNHGSSLVYTITPNTGYEINQVFVNSAPTSATIHPTTGVGTYTFSNVTANQTIMVTFKLRQYTLTFNPSTGTVNPTSIPVTYSQQISINPLPTPVQANCIFKGWFIDGTQISNTTIWNYNTDKTAIAIWEYPIVLTIQNPELGTVTPAGNVNYSLGDNQTYTFAPHEGAHIESIVIDGITKFTGNSEVTQEFTHDFIDIKDYHSITVKFAQNCYAINPGNIPGNAVISMSPSTCVLHGSPVTFTFNVDDCYDITEVFVNGVSQGAISSYTINSVEEKLPLLVVQTELRKYAIEASPAQGEGTYPMCYITPNGTFDVNCNENQNFIFTMPIGYRVKTLLVNGEPVSLPTNVYNYTLHNIKEHYTIHVEFEENPQYVIQFGPSASQNAGGVVYPTSEPQMEDFVPVDSGTPAFSFSIVPDFGYLIDVVYVDDVPNAIAAITGVYTFTDINNHHSIHATFKPQIFTITASASQGGTLTPDGDVQVPYNTDQTFHAIPDNGYKISAVIVDGQNMGTPDTYTFTNVAENHTISAIFEKETYLITAIAEANGTITPGSQYVEFGDDITFTFTPNLCYKIDKVLIDGVNNLAAAQNGTYTFTNVSQVHEIKVTFTKMTFTIVATHTLGGVITPAGTATIECGEHSAIYVFIPEDGYMLHQVLIDGEDNFQAVDDGIYRFLDVAADHTIHAIFVPDAYTITASASIGGVITPSGVVSVASGANKTFLFTADSGYELTRVLVDNINIPDAVESKSYTFTEVLADHTIAASFEKVTYNIHLPNVTGATAIPQPGYTTTVEHGSSFAFVVELAAGYTQSNIIVRTNNIAVIPVGGVYTINNITVDQTITIDGVAINQYTIVATAFAGGSITPSGTFMMNHGDAQLFTISANNGFKVDEVRLNGIPVELDGVNYLLENIVADATIEARFKLNAGIIDPESTVTVYSYDNVVTISNETLVPVKSVEIMDMAGRMIWSGQIPTESKTEINLSAAVGIYSVRIITNDNRLITTKVSIN